MKASFTSGAPFKTDWAFRRAYEQVMVNLRIYQQTEMVHFEQRSGPHVNGFTRQVSLLAHRDLEHPARVLGFYKTAGDPTEPTQRALTIWSCLKELRESAEAPERRSQEAKICSFN